MRYLFDGGEQVVDAVGNAQVGFPFVVWDDPFAGSQVTDFTLPDGVTAATPATDSDGEVLWLRGPDEVRGPLYRDAGTGTRSVWYSSEAIEMAQDEARQALAAVPAAQSAQVAAEAAQAAAEQAASASAAGIPAGTTLDSIPDSGTRVAMSPTERAKLGGVAAGATNLQLGYTITAAKPGNWVPSAADVGAVRNAGGLTRMWKRTIAQGFPTAAQGAVDGDVLVMDAS